MESRELSPSITAVKSGQSHTPGPWHVDPERTDGFAPWVRMNDGAGEIYYIAGLADMGGEEQANARLIAAAPDLLEACRALLAERSSAAQLSNASQAARAAIAKAVGVSALPDTPGEVDSSSVADRRQVERPATEASEDTEAVTSGKGEP